MQEVKFGPEGFDKIALIGSAPSSVRLAPYSDQSWAIWGCSPGAFGMVQRADVWWEIHRWEPPAIGKPFDPGNVPWFSPEYAEWLRKFPGPVITSQPVESITNCVPLNFDQLLAK